MANGATGGTPLFPGRSVAKPAQSHDIRRMTSHGGVNDLRRFNVSMCRTTG
jgi:hypothetical protein